MDTYRVAILGCRNRGGHAGRAYKAHRRTEVVGLCDVIEERVNELGDELGVAARYTDLDVMIEETKPVPPTSAKPKCITIQLFLGRILRAAIGMDPGVIGY